VADGRRCSTLHGAVERRNLAPPPDIDFVAQGTLHFRRGNERYRNAGRHRYNSDIGCGVVDVAYVFDSKHAYLLLYILYLYLYLLCALRA
jgi:hypothetical protein